MELIFISVKLKEYNIEFYILMKFYLICSIKGVDMLWQFAHKHCSNLLEYILE